MFFCCESLPWGHGFCFWCCRNVLCTRNWIIKLKKDISEPLIILFDLISYCPLLCHSAPATLHSAVAGTCQVCAQLQAFALAFPCAWNVLRPAICSSACNLSSTRGSAQRSPCACDLPLGPYLKQCPVSPLRGSFLDHIGKHSCLLPQLLSLSILWGLNVTVKSWFRHQMPVVQILVLTLV